MSYEPPTGPQNPPAGWNQPPVAGPPPRRQSRHRTRNILLSLASAAFLLIVIGIVAAVAGAPKPAGSSSVTGGTSSPAPAAPAAAVPTTPPPSTPTTVTFMVSGTGEPSIQYGNNSDNISPPQCTGGDLGESCTLGFTATLPYTGTAEYWNINAQLDSSGGTISCSITVSGPGDKPLVVASGQASGAFQICDAQAAPTDPSGLSWQSEG